MHIRQNPNDWVEDEFETVIVMVLLVSSYLNCLIVELETTIVGWFRDVLNVRNMPFNG
jgi:hypothetical protein